MPSKSQNADVWAILSRRFPPSEYALLQEVSNDAGFRRDRSLDFMVMSLWPSRGLAITGIEMKRSRYDWLKEKKNPAKAEAFAKYCDYFYLLTVGEEIVLKEEIPETWGWLNIKGSKVYTMKEAPKLQPETLTKGVVAAMLKRACAIADNYVTRESIEARLEEAKEQGKREANNGRDSTLKDYRELLTQVREFEVASGIKISDNWMFNAKRTGEAVRFLIAGGLDKQVKELQRLKESAEKIATNVISVLELLPLHENGNGQEVIKDSQAAT